MESPRRIYCQLGDITAFFYRMKNYKGNFEFFNRVIDGVSRDYTACD